VRLADASVSRRHCELRREGACFKLFDRSPHAWKMIPKWVRQKGEFQKRAGFVLIACLAQHDKDTADAQFARFFPMIEMAAADDRNFVKKGVSWALRGLGHRSRPLHAAALELARELAASDNPGERWVGKDALRDITRPLVVAKISRRYRGVPDGRAWTPRTAPAIMRFNAAIDRPPSSVGGIVANPIADAFGYRLKISSNKRASCSLDGPLGTLLP
jgi:hypothetical protein